MLSLAFLSLLPPLSSLGRTVKTLSSGCWPRMGRWASGPPSDVAGMLCHVSLVGRQSPSFSVEPRTFRHLLSGFWTTSLCTCNPPALTQEPVSEGSGAVRAFLLGPIGSRNVAGARVGRTEWSSPRAKRTGGTNHRVQSPGLGSRFRTAANKITFLSS